MPSQSKLSDSAGFQNRPKNRLECKEKDQTGKSQANAACQNLGSQEKQEKHQEPLLQEQPPLGNLEINMKDENGDCKTSPCLPAFEQKDALALFNIINPGSSCTIEKIALGSNIIFSAVFGHDDKIQASGLGISEEEAKRDAAENGIRLYVSQVICENLQNIGQEFEEINLPSDEKIRILTLISSYATDKFCSEKKKLAAEMSKPKSTFIEGQKKSDGWFELLIKNQYPLSVLGWGHISSFTSKYMIEVYLARTEKARRQELSPESNVKIKDNRTDVGEKKLPKNACELHPPDLLEIMNPGTCSFEVGRKGFVVEMGYKINNKIYTGVGSSKKEAKLQAAKKAMEKVYDVKYFK